MIPTADQLPTPMPAGMANTRGGRSRHEAAIVFALAAAIALAFAFFTDQRWEDYYITFRTSKHVAAGHGLVFQPGERVHTFTSPLGVLLPAVAVSVTGGTSDETALWLFRAMSILAFGGTAALLYRISVALGWRRSVCGFATLLFATDAKAVSFTINGMETAFVLLFLAWSVHSLVSTSPTARWQLGAAWAGLMWTRPDSFIYIGATAFAVWLFPAAQRLAPDRRQLFRNYLGAALLCAVLYAPWLFWASWYYGSPIPHTITAKALSRAPLDWFDAFRTLITLPFHAWHSGVWDTVFTPPYSISWPLWAIHIGRALVFIPLTALLWPAVRPEARAMSLAVVLGVFYLGNLWLFPWYIPPVTFLAVLVLGSVGESLCAARQWTRRTIWIPFAPWFAAMSCTMVLLVGTAWQSKWQQELVEGQRRRVGEWLREHRHTEHDTVFLEPLGYIGYFSQLKMFDYPGLASPEVVAARRQFGDDWVDLIKALQPTWVVARPGEPHTSGEAKRAWFATHYASAEVFDVSARIAAVPHVIGRSFLQCDQRYVVYRRRE